MTNTHQGLQIPVGYYFCSRSATVHLHQAGLDFGWKIIDKPNPASSPHQFTQTAYLIVQGGGEEEETDFSPNSFLREVCLCSE